MYESGLRRTIPDQMSGSLNTFGTARHSSITDPILSKRVCFYKSGDPQFGGLRMVINNRTFKTFDALLDSLSKKVPLPFGVRNITTPRGVHGISTLDDLEDGKSYICSDRRRVKPINLAEARKKPTPWYHARPVSSRRRTVQQARMFPGQSVYRKEPVVVRTPKRLLVFRNGDPSVKHMVVLQRRTTPTFQSILEYISELMQFPVIKLYTPDGRRIDGLPSLILSSGTVVAAGRESFWPANYTGQKTSPPRKMPANRATTRRHKALNRKKKSLSFASESRNFSPSSQKYIVNQIHKTMGKRSNELSSYQTNSVEVESSHLLSVAEMESLNDESEEYNCVVPSEDDIEKSFRVNQDGSMTVEMKVRLTIKEEETLHWTTTVSRSTVANQLHVDSLPDIDQAKHIDNPATNSVDIQNFSADAINPYRTKDDFDDDPPPLASQAVNHSHYEEESIKTQMDVEAQIRTPSPGLKQVRTKQASIESIRSMTADGIHEDTVGSFSYSERTENGAMTEQYCMVRQSSTRPVPKPRRLGSLDAHSTNRAFTSGEILQIDSSREEVTETLLHIYEHRSSPDNFLANLCRDDGSMSGISNCRPSTSETGRLSSANELEHEYCRPSTASECISTWKNDNLSLASDFTIPTLQNGTVVNVSKRQQKSTNSPASTEKSQQKVAKNSRTSPKLVKKRLRRLKSPAMKKKGNSPKKGKTFSSAGFLKGIYGSKTKSPKRKAKKKKRATQSESNVASNSPNTSMAPGKETKVHVDTTPQEIPEVSRSRTTLRRQTSLYQEKTNYINGEMPQQDFSSSCSASNEYVENWLYTAQMSSNETQMKGSLQSESNEKLFNVAEGVKCLDEKIKSNNSFKAAQPPQNLIETSVKQRIKSFENQLTPMEQITLTQTATGKTGNHNITGVKTCFNGISTTNYAENDEDFPPPPAENLIDFEDKMLDHCTSSVSPQSVKTSSAQSLEMKAENDASPGLSRSTSVKRIPLVSNQSLERKMSLRKTCLDNGLEGNVHPEGFVLMNSESPVDCNMLVNGNCSTENGKIETGSRQSSSEQSSSLTCTSVSPSSQISDDCASSASILSSEPSALNNIPKKISSPKNLRGPERSPTSVRKLKNDPFDSADKNLSKKIATQKTPNHSPATKKKMFSKSKHQPSPYSQSLDMMSANARQNALLSRTLSSDGSTEQTKTTQDKRKSKEALTSDTMLAAEARNVNTRKDLNAVTQKETSVEEEHLKNQIMKLVLDKICQSVKAVRDSSGSCGLSDLSSHVESTFGSSSHDLLTFLSIMTLKHSLTKQYIEQLNAKNVSSTEAFKMISTLGEISGIEDSSRLRGSLCELRTSASETLMENWMEFCSKDRCKEELITQLDLPESLKEELASLSEINTGSHESKSNGSQNEALVITKDSQEGFGAEKKALKQTSTHTDNFKSIPNGCAVRAEEGLDRQSSESNLLPVMSNAERMSKEGCSEVGKGQQQLCRTEENECHQTQPQFENKYHVSSDFVDGGETDHDRKCPEQVLGDMYGEETLSDSSFDKSQSQGTRHQMSKSVQESSSMGSMEEESEVEYEEREQDGNQSGAESPSEEEDHDYLGLNANRKESAANEKQYLSVEPHDTNNRQINGFINDAEDRQVLGICPGTKLNVIIEESFCGQEEEQDEGQILDQNGREDSLSVDKVPGDKTWTTNPLEMSHSSTQLEDQDPLIVKSRTFNSNLSKPGSDAEDSGNDHRSCEEQIESHLKAGQTRGSIEEETSAYEEECSSDEEAVMADGYKENAKSGKTDEKLKETEVIITQSVAERVNLLEKQVAEAKKTISTTESSVFRSYSHRNGHLGDDTQAIPPSSLSFSYDSSGVITTEPESNKVKSIRDMFLAKTSNDIPALQKHSNSTNMSDLRTDTSASAGYQSQTSSEVSSGEEDVSKKSITKGFVRRTIERLYGRNNVHHDEDEKDRPTSASKQKTDYSSMFSPFHAARTKAMPDMSYFHSTSALNTLTEATGCFAFNVQVEPTDHIEADGWLSRENSLIRKSLSDPIGISKNLAHRKETEESEETPYSFFSTNSEPEENQQSQSRKCTYFSLPHTSESDTVPDDVSKRSMNVDVGSEANSQVWAEKNGSPTSDFKKRDNKVHPLIEAPPDSEVVVAQPVKQQTVANRHIQDPDMLDFLYNFCGEHCPIL
ncbi:oxygen-regulated protein 1-like [Synchiropus splendidus]|uniref:oxygen-regulated protein 1-like n=1 Tax=Synchiropus splendidus TaxID=270530 RepID=UPI00237D5C7D|nr:oxygen-regulated protein 1-like [Synchiropus splendidus]